MPTPAEHIDRLGAILVTVASGSHVAYISHIFSPGDVAALRWAIASIQAANALVGAVCVPLEVLRGEVETGACKELCPGLQREILAASDALRQFATLAAQEKGPPPT